METEEKKLLFSDYLVRVLFWLVIGFSIGTWDFTNLVFEVLVLELYINIKIARIIRKFVDKYS